MHIFSYSGPDDMVIWISPSFSLMKISCTMHLEISPLKMINVSDRAELEERSIAVCPGRL